MIYNHTFIVQVSQSISFHSFTSLSNLNPFPFAQKKHSCIDWWLDDAFNMLMKCNKIRSWWNFIFFFSLWIESIDIRIQSIVVSKTQKQTQQTIWIRKWWRRSCFFIFKILNLNRFVIDLGTLYILNLQLALHLKLNFYLFCGFFF